MLDDGPTAPAAGEPGSPGAADRRARPARGAQPPGAAHDRGRSDTRVVALAPPDLRRRSGSAVSPPVTWRFLTPAEIEDAAPQHRREAGRGRPPEPLPRARRARHADVRSSGSRGSGRIAIGRRGGDRSRAAGRAGRDGHARRRTRSLARGPLRRPGARAGRRAPTARAPGEPARRRRERARGSGSSVLLDDARLAATPARERGYDPGRLIARRACRAARFRPLSPAELEAAEVFASSRGSRESRP